MNVGRTHVEVDVKPRIQRIGAPNSRAVFALITIWTPVPYVICEQKEEPEVESCILEIP